MKHLLSHPATFIALCLLLVPHAPAEDATLRAGTAVVDITPEPDVPLAGPVGGGGNASQVHDPLEARAIAIHSGETRIVLCVCDLTMMASELHEQVRDLVEKVSGLPGSHLLVSTTHTHRAPRAIELELGPAHDRYRRELPGKIARAISDALENLEPAQIGWGSVEKPEHTRNRRWLMKEGTLGPNPFGEKTDRARMYGGPGKNAIRALGPVDPELSVLSIKRPDGSQLALFANFGIHYGQGGGGVSADYFGYFRRYAEEMLGGESVTVMMSNGTSGDIAPGGKPDPLGQSLARSAVEAIKEIDHHRNLPITARVSTLSLGVRRPDAERLEWARAVLDGTWNQPAHRWKNKYARSTLWLSEYPPEVPVRLQVIRIGDLAIAGIPCEVYAETGLAIKEASPIADTFVVSLANGYNGYLPTPQQHKLGGYTTWPAVSSHLETEAEPQIRAEIQRLLQSIK